MLSKRGIPKFFSPNPEVTNVSPETSQGKGGGSKGQALIRNSAPSNRTALYLLKQNELISMSIRTESPSN